MRKLVIILDLILSIISIIFLIPIFFILWIYKKIFISNNNSIRAYIIGSSYTISDMNKKTDSVEHLMTVLNPGNTFDKIILNFFPGKENIDMNYENHFFFERRQLFKGTLLQLNGLYFVFSIVISLYYSLKYNVNLIYGYDPHGGGLLAVIVSKILSLKSGMSQGTDYWETKIVPEFVQNENIRRLVEKFVYNRIDIIEIPHSYIETIRKYYGEELANKCIPYHFPINIEYIDKSKSSKSIKVDKIIENIKNKKIVLTVSRISSEKYYEEYIKLVKLNKENEDIVFLYVGDGPEREKFLELTKNLGNFLWIPSLSNYEVIYLYSKIDIFIGIYVGMALREAMAVGCAIAVYSWDVLKYDLSDAGLQIEPFNVEELKKEMNLILRDNELLNSLKVKSRRRAINVLSTTKVGSIRRKRYENLIRGKDNEA